MKTDLQITARARELRGNMTPAEKIVWSIVRNRQFADFKFRRQQPFGTYILDFYCAEVMLAIELDGETHLGKEVHDEKRQKWIEAQGIQVMRFWNTEIYDEKDAVSEAIFRACDGRRGVRGGQE